MGSIIFRYCGEYFDKETGTIYLRARYYNPVVGRFITEDSVWGNDSDPLSLNLYTYCYNDPINYSDPSGFSRIIITVGDTGASYGHDAGGAFSKSAETYIKENTTSEDEIWVLYCGEVYWSDSLKQGLIKSADGITYITYDIEGLSNTYGHIASYEGKIDKMIFFGHGDPGVFYAFDAKGQNMYGNNNSETGEHWNKNWFNKNATIAIYACNSGSGGNDSFAQNIANSTGATAWGFTSFMGFV